MTDLEQFLKTISAKELDERKTWYSSVADAYNQVRPRYPQQLIHRAVELAKLSTDASILEVGCGPGIATTAFAQFGFSMVCLEPSQEACQLAQQNFQQYPNVEIINNSFEEWEPENKQFDAVLAANSFHWLSPDIRCSKAASVLNAKGSLILLWNTPPQPNDEVSQMLKQVYQTYAPSLAEFGNRETHEENLKNFSHSVIESGYFNHLVSEQIESEAIYNLDDYLALLSTFSPYIMLEPQQRTALFLGLRETLARDWGKSIPTSYLSALHIARKPGLSQQSASSWYRWARTQSGCILLLLFSLC